MHWALIGLSGPIAHYLRSTRSFVIRPYLLGFLSSMTSSHLGQWMVGFRNRYMVMEVFMNPNRDQVGGDNVIITQFNVSKAIRDSILVNSGECGLASSLGSFQVKYVNPITNVCIIRASREEYQKVWASITMVRTIGNFSVMFNLLDLSGSLRACKTAALKCEESKFEQFKLMVGDRFSTDDAHRMNSYLDRIKVLEH